MAAKRGGMNMKRGKEMKWTEYNAKDALNRLDYAIQMTKDEGNDPRIMLYARECGLQISKNIARNYIKTAFDSMDRSHMRNAKHVASAKSTFTINKTDYGVTWVDARLKTTRTEENKAKHALMDAARKEIWSEEE
jgi:hypothetical protein